MKGEEISSFKLQYSFKRRHLMIIGILVIAFSLSFMFRSLPLQYGIYLNEFDPYFDYRATKFLVDNGFDAYFKWHDTMSWYPEGRDIAATSQSGLHISAAVLYKAFGGGMKLYDFVVWFPVVIGSLTSIVFFALVRVISGTTAGLFASIFFAISPAIIQRGNLGWFKSEPLGLFLSLVALYLFLSALKQKEMHFSIAKAVGAGLILGFAMTAWGGIQYFPLPLGIFFIALPFFSKNKNMIYAVPILTILTIAVASAFPRPGAGFATSLAGLAMIGPTIFLIASYFISSYQPKKSLRNMLIWLGIFIAIAVGVVAAGTYTPSSYRYFSVINPFAKTEIPLVESVAEHFTPTIVEYFVNYAMLIPLAGYGAYLCFRKRSDMSVFALILGITGVYVSASFTRLLVFSSIGLITLASIALFEITRSIYERKSEEKIVKKTKLQYTSKDFRIPYTALIIAMLIIPTFYPLHSNWLAVADIPPSITNGATNFRISTNDWIDAMEWIKQNTEKDAVIASWWDYGYWITTLGERTTLADNATINMTRIQQLAKALTSDEHDALNILNDLKADYILVYMVGQRVSLSNEENLIILGGGGDESKKQWFMRIAGVDESKFIESDGFTSTPAFWNGTLLGRLFPLQPAGYVKTDASGKPTDLQAEYKPGYLPLYVEQVKYNSDEQPFKLVYASPSFTNKNERIVLAILLYKITGKGATEEVKSTPVDYEQRLADISAKLEANKEYALLNISIAGKDAGTIVMELFPSIAPNTVKSFEDLISSGFYDGIKIHRIVPDFVIQGGDPNTRDKPRETWGTGGPGYSIPAEISNMTHARGIVSMAHPPGDTSSGSQFFIVVKDASYLDGDYTIFGKVIEGMDLVDEINKLPRDNRDIPLINVVIEKAYVIKK